MKVETAEDFVRVLEHGSNEERQQLRRIELDEEVWIEIIEDFPAHKGAVIFAKTVPLTVLEILADDPSIRIRSEVAMKRKLPRAMLEMLANDEAADVRAAVAQNHSTPKELLSKLTSDDEDWVARAATRMYEYRFGET